VGREEKMGTGLVRVARVLGWDNEGKIRSSYPKK